MYLLLTVNMLLFEALDSKYPESPTLNKKLATEISTKKIGVYSLI